MSATSIVGDRLMVYVENNWIDAIEHMKGAIHKAAILAQKEGAATFFNDLKFLIAPVTTKIKESADSSISEAIDKFQELAGKNVEAEFSVGEIIDILEEIGK